LVLFSFVFLIAWMFQFRSSIINSNRPNTPNSGVYADLENNEESPDLQGMDTDSDGISDWEELNVHGTSPYLEDSDSDGFSDGDELESGNDPTCPAGRDCYGTGIGKTDNIPNPVNSNNVNSENEEFVNSLLNQTNPDEGTALENMLSGQVDAATLRQVLLDSGMDNEILSNISDEELMRTYAETLSSGN